MNESKGALDGTVDRRRFTVASAMAILSGVVITIADSGCGSDYSPSMPSPTPTPAPNPSPSGDKIGTISANHGHEAIITAAELAAGTGFVLRIQGQATHPHSVELAAADLTAIAGGQKVSKESTTDSGHSHTVTFN